MQIICTSLQTDIHVSTSPLIFTGRMPNQTMSMHWSQNNNNSFNSFTNTIGTTPVAGFCKPAAIGLKPMTTKCLTHIRYDHGSKLKLLPIPAGIPAGFGGYVPIPIPVHISTARHSSSGRQSNFAAFNRGRHLYWSGRPSRWALAHILVCY